MALCRCKYEATCCKSNVFMGYCSDWCEKYEPKIPEIDEQVNKKPEINEWIKPFMDSLNSSLNS